MIDMAGEEESKEALLVYLFLSQNANDMNKEKLDSAIEIYVSETYGIEMDFEVDDGLDKLRSLGILIEEGGVLKVTDPTKALQLLDTNNKE
jgi:hypothetical protein